MYLLAYLLTDWFIEGNQCYILTKDALDTFFAFGLLAVDYFLQIKY